MPASAVQTKAWYRPKGWFTDREISLVVNRVLRDDPSKGDMHNRQAVTPKRLWESLKDFDLWPLYILGLIVFIPPNPPVTYITLTLRKLGFDPFTTNLLTIPYVGHPWCKPCYIVANGNSERFPYHQSDPHHATIRVAQRAYTSIHDTSSLDTPMRHCPPLVAWGLWSTSGGPTPLSRS